MLGFLVDAAAAAAVVMKATRHLEGGDMRSGVMDDTFGSIFYQILEYLQRL
jgi:hypothetical protein